VTRRQLGNALAVCLFAASRAEGTDLEAAGEAFLVAIDGCRRRERIAKRRGPCRTPRDERWLPVVERVAAKHGITVDELRASSRHVDIVAARWEAIWELRSLTPPMSYPEAGRAVGLANHTSAISGYRKHAAKLAAAAQPLRLISGGRT
jgi:hypothetical protein